MKKLLLFAVVLLSACARDITVYQHYNTAVPTSKAKLHIEIPNRYTQQTQGEQWWHEAWAEMKNTPELQKTYSKYFTESFPKNADFILKEINRQEKKSNFFVLSLLTIFIVPTWDTYEETYSFSLTNAKTGTEVSLKAVTVKDKVYQGWFLSPMLFSKKTSFMAGNPSPRAYAQAIEEAASMVYDVNSPLYKQSSGWTPPVPANPASAVNAAPVSAPVVAPAKEPSPQDMDLLW